MNVYLNGFYDGEKKWKDKINQKIDELESQYKDNALKYVSDTNQFIVDCVAILEELLED